MQRFILSIIFAILIAYASTEDLTLSEDPQRTGRFGFGFFEPLRQMFCNNSCKSSESMMYIMDLACLLKCPELYVEQNHQQTTTAAPSTTMPSATTIATAAPTTTMILPTTAPATTPPATSIATPVAATTTVSSTIANPNASPGTTGSASAGNGTMTTGNSTAAAASG